MTTAEDYATIANQAYGVDPLQREFPAETGDKIAAPGDDRQPFRVLDTAIDPPTGLSARGGGSREGPKTRLIDRLVLSAGIWAALATGLAGCAWEGREVNTETNLANQRKAAIAFLETQGGVERIRFTQEGSLSGFGAPWAVNAVVTVNGEEYNEILGTERYSWSGQPFPDIAPETEPAPVTVIYSDASSEVIE